MMRSLCSIALLSLCAGACQSRGSHYDAPASEAFRAAWEKRRAGDENGYRAALADVAKRRGTWAGDRAAIDLELADDTSTDSMLARLLKQAAEVAGDPSKLPNGLQGPVGIVPAPAK